MKTLVKFFTAFHVWIYRLSGGKLGGAMRGFKVLDKVIPSTAEVLSGEARAQAWRQVIATAPSFAGYEKRTTREIPLILLHPNQ